MLDLCIKKIVLFKNKKKLYVMSWIKNPGHYTSSYHSIIGWLYKEGSRSLLWLRLHKSW